jgi:hypothetical protein
VTEGHSERARSVYELHVIHPHTAERHTQQLKNLLGDFVLGGLPLAGSPGNVFVKVTVGIVDRRTGETVLSMNELVEVATGLVDLLDADLDRLDPATFADEWGI